MAKVDTVDNVVRARVLQKLKQYDATVKSEVAKEAKRQGHTVVVKKVEFLRLILRAKEVRDLRFGALTIDPKNTDIVVYSMEYDNNSDTTDTVEFAYHQERSDAWHWELKTGVTFTYTAEAKIPELASLSQSVQVDFSVSYGQAAEEKRSWDWKATPQIPPRSRVVVHAVLNQVAGGVPVTCRVKVNGVVQCRGTFGVKWLPDQQREFDIPLERLLNDAERTYTTEGVITGASGMNSSIRKEQEVVLTAGQRKDLPAGTTERALTSAWSLERLSLKSPSRRAARAPRRPQ
jgi:hypothetical protein